VSEIIVSPNNSQTFRAGELFDMLSIGHASRNQRSRWSILGASVVYGNISCGRGSTKLPGASIVAKSENSDGRSTPVECISGPCKE